MEIISVVLLPNLLHLFSYKEIRIIIPIATNTSAELFWTELEAISTFTQYAESGNIDEMHFHCILLKGPTIPKLIWY